MRKIAHLLIVLVGVTLGAANLSAQDTSSITGVVTDASGAVVPGAKVELKNPATGRVYSAVTNSVGSYLITNVAPGPGYTETVTRDGFETGIVNGMYLNVSNTRTQNITLKTGSVQESVAVSASNQDVTLNTTDATIGNNFQVQYLNDLPVQVRDSPSALFTMQPGVTLDGAVTGARTDQNNVTVDGLEVNDNATGSFGAIVGAAPVDSVQEFRGTTAGQTASAGQGGGGQYELVTRSGTNSFHGGVVEYHRDAALTANDWFNNNVGTPRSPLIRNQYGAFIGGPIKRNRLTFFFDWNARRDTISSLVERIVPMGTDTSGFRGGEVAYKNSTGGTTTLTPTQVANLDPAHIGWNQAEIQLFQKRYPIANDLTGGYGDHINTAGYRFNAPQPYIENTYVERVDWNMTSKMKLFGVGTVQHRDSIQSSIQFPGDPVTAPSVDRSYRWTVGHNWQISDNMINQAQFGIIHEDYSFDIVYNPQGDYQYSFAGLDGPYKAGSNSQHRTYPIDVVRDDFTWVKGRHSFNFGGTFKWDTPDEFAAENYYSPSIGVTGNTYLTSLAVAAGQPSLRPADIQNNSTVRTYWDRAFSTALGVNPVVTANFNYDNTGKELPMGSGLDLKYRYYETEIYFNDIWKMSPDLTLTYGVRYQNYTVPYETRGRQAITNLNDNGKTEDFSWDTFWGDRLAQSKAGITTPTSLPYFQFIYGGKANNQDSYYHPNNKNFAPHVALSWNPSFDKKSVFHIGGGVLYDHSEINALQFQQLQTSYLFEAANTLLNGTSGDANATVKNAPRFAGLNSPPPVPATPKITTPNVPFVDADGVPYGLQTSQFNLMMDTKLKTPYNIIFNFGFQHEFPQGFIFKMDYDGRLGRRLLATADSSQLLDFPDSTGRSNQSMGQAFAGLTTQLRNSGDDYNNVQPEPWFENMMGSGATSFVASALDPLPYYGDFADVIEYLSNYLPSNVGMASQFASNSVWTNKGSSNYHGLLVTLHKNAGHGLQFDLNYTWSHSIDNVSIIANSIASSNGNGFICDVQRPRECRGNSTFDVTNYLNGNFIYELPFGRGREIGSSVPYWLNEVVGGWSLSGLPSWHSGKAYNANGSAFVTSYANDAPAILTGNPSLLRAKVNGGNGARVNIYKDQTAAIAAFTGPVGFDMGGRNNLRGPGYFNLDLGLGKTFPVWSDRVNLKFRADAFNSTNHPSFSLPSQSNSDITESNGVPFGTITGTDSSPRVLQLSLRLEF